MENIENFYDEVALSIKRIKEQLLIEDQDSESEQINKQILEDLANFELQGLHELEQLKKYQDWNTFIIAFYGETNAGKSTLIESLRLYFNEETKMQQRKEFEEKSASYLAIREKEQRLCNLSAMREKKEEDLRQFLLEQKFFSKIWIFLGLNAWVRQIKNEILNISKEIDSIGTIDKSGLKEILKEILNLQDGNIIGDGRSDFTREVKEYRFQYQEENFILLDVPGIEGSESKVLEEIGNATKKAHAIFYVKKDPTPPQKGDKGKKGTIEKIKEQLNAQTEVWTIYNKPITNPRVLSKDLIDNNTQESLDVLDGEMKKILEENYLGHKVVSAQPAFFSLASVFPDTELGIKRRDFLDKCAEHNMTEKEVLTKSGFVDFADFLSNTFIQDTKQKIRNSNFNKAYVVVNSLGKKLIKNIKHRKNKYKKDEEITDAIKKKIDSILDGFILNLHNLVVREEMERMIRTIRKETYDYIDLDKKDKEVEAYLKEQIEKQMKIFEKNIETIANEQKEILQNDVQEALKKYQEQIQENLADASRVEIFDEFGNKINVDIDQNFDFFGFFSSLGTTALGVWGGFALLATPVGWITIVASVLTGIIGVVRVVIGWLDKDYKKARQRESVDENLEKVETSVKDQIENIIQQNEEELERKMSSIKKKMDVLLYRGQKQIVALEKEGYELEQIAKAIKEEIK